MKYLQQVIFTSILFFSTAIVFAQQVNNFSQKQIDSVLHSVTGLSGSGKLIVGNGDGWRSGSDAVQYDGPYAERGWIKMPAERIPC